MQSIFVSSSFKDMQKERDLIHSIVLPEINEFLRTTYGQETTMVDLRWGIDTSGYSEKKAMLTILRVCLSEINRCKPFMLVLIGDRYGTVVPKQLLRRLVQNDIPEELTTDDISVTEFEIRYAMHLAQSDRMNCLFYFRDVDYTNISQHDRNHIYTEQDASSRTKLNNLKQEIRARFPDKCHRYKTHWDLATGKMCGFDLFADQLIADLKQCISEELGPPRITGPMETAWANEQAFIQASRAQFVGRSEPCRTIQAFLSQKNDGVLLLHGAPGVGKSAFMASLPDMLTHEKWDYLSVFCGVHDLCDTSTGLARNVLWKLQQKLGSAQEPDALLKPLPAHHLHELITAAITQYFTKTDKTLVLLLDAVDHLTSDMQTGFPLFPMPSLGDRLKIILSVESARRADFLLTHFGQIDELELLPPTPEETAQVLDRIWYKYGKVSVAEVIRKQLLKKTLCSNPLYLNLLVCRLSLLGEELFGKENNSEKTIRREILRIIADFPDDLGLAASELVHAIGAMLDPTLAEAVMKYLRAVPNGLRSTDLEALCVPQWNEAHFVYLTKLFGRFLFVRADHRIDFTHGIFRHSSSGQTAAREPSAYEELFCHACMLPDSDLHKGQYLVCGAYHSGHIPAIYQTLERAVGDSSLVQQIIRSMAHLIHRDADAADAFAEAFPFSPSWDTLLEIITEQLLPLLAADRNTIRFCATLYRRLSNTQIPEDLPVLPLRRLYAFAEAYWSIRRDYSGNIQQTSPIMLQIAQRIMEKSPDPNTYYTCYSLMLNEDALISEPEAAAPYLQHREPQMRLLAAKYLIRYGDKHFVAANTNKGQYVCRQIDTALELLRQLPESVCRSFGYDITELYLLAGDIFLRADRIKGSRPDSPLHRRNMYSRAAACYIDAKAQLLLTPGGIRQLLQLLEVHSRMMTVYQEWNLLDWETLFRDTLTLLETVELYACHLGDSQRLAQMYGKLCCILTDLLGSKLEAKAHTSINRCSHEEVAQLREQVQQWDIWSDRAIRVFTQLAAVNPSPAFTEHLFHVMKSKIKLLQLIQTCVSDSNDRTCAEETIGSKKRAMLLIRLIQVFETGTALPQPGLSRKNADYRRFMAVLSQNLLFWHANAKAMKEYHYSPQELAHIQQIGLHYVELCESLLRSRDPLDREVLEHILRKEPLEMFNGSISWFKLQHIKRSHDRTYRNQEFETALKSRHSYMERFSDLETCH